MDPFEAACEITETFLMRDPSLVPMEPSELGAEVFGVNGGGSLVLIFLSTSDVILFDNNKSEGTFLVLVMASETKKIIIWQQNHWEHVCSLQAV